MRNGGRKLLIEWSDHCTVYRALHATSANLYKRKNAYFRIPALIITSIGAGLAFSVSMFPVDHGKYIPTCVGILNLVASTFSSIANFCKTSERAEGHRLAAVAFSKLRRKIQEKLTLEYEIQDDFVRGVKEDFDALVEVGPSVDEAVIRAFREMHIDSKLQMPVLVRLGGLNLDGHHPSSTPKFDDEKRRELSIELKPPVDS